MAQNVIINGVTYSNVPEVDIPKSGGGTATFYDTSTADAGTGDVLSGKKYFADGGEKTGAMTNNGATGGTISTKAGTVAIPSGYTSGGSVSIASAQQDLIISGNIKSGVTLLGVSGSSMVLDTTIASGGAGASNIISGYKAYVNGSMIVGEATIPTVSQNTTTKVLTIS